MSKILNWLLTFVLCLSLGSSLVINSDVIAAERGTLTGGAPHEVPDWFKESFLEIADDAEEAGEASKHVMLFFHLNDCPYCDRMLTEAFKSDPYKKFIQSHFDVIAINVRGDRDVVFNDELEMTEKQLADQLRVFATPAIIFLNKSNEQVVRTDGYRAPDRFQKTLNYVSSKTYKTMNFADYLERSSTDSIYSLRDHKLFTTTDDLSVVKGPLLVIFENSSCYECAEFHERLLSRDDVGEELGKFTVVRLDTDSDQKIIDVDGTKTTASDLAKKHQMTFRPGVLVFEEASLVGRYDSLLFSYHFKEGLRYVADGFYKKEDRRSYSERRLEELLSAGVDINLAE